MRFSIIAFLAAGALGFPFSDLDNTVVGAPISLNDEGLVERDLTMSSTLLHERATPTTYREIAIFAHNLHRKNHSAPDVTWNKSLKAAAKEVAESCYFAHNVSAGGGGYGQNIAAGVKSDNISAVITNLWYNSEVGWFRGLYGQSQPSMVNFAHWGHFSQIVWKQSTQIGCFTADCSAKGLGGVGGSVPPYFTVCNYKGPGNFANEYGANIGKPLGEPTADWNTGL